MAEKAELLFPLNTLIQELRLAGWDEQVEALVEVRELVWTDDLVFVPNAAQKIMADIMANSAD